MRSSSLSSAWSLADLADGHYGNFTSFLDEIDIRHLLLVFRKGAATQHLRRCLALSRAVAHLTQGLYGDLDPDSIVGVVLDQIGARLDTGTQPVLRARLGQLDDHQVRALIAALCQATDQGAGQRALALMTDANPYWVRITFGHGLRLNRSWVTAWARTRLLTWRTGPSRSPPGLPLDVTLDAVTDDDDTIRRALQAADHLNPSWSGDQIRALMDSGYDPDRASTAAAISALHPEALRSLLDCQQTPSLVLMPDANGDRMTAIARAADDGDTDRLRVLLAFLARFDRVRVGVPTVLAAEIRSMTPLTLAAYRGHADAVRILLDFIPEPQRALALGQRDFRGRTAIHWAAYNCHEEALRVLLQGCSQRQDQVDLVASVDSILGGNRPDQYRHLPMNIKRVFEELQTAGSPDLPAAAAATAAVAAREMLSPAMVFR